MVRYSETGGGKTSSVKMCFVVRLQLFTFAAIKSWKL